jgi:hypothetical protein
MSGNSVYINKYLPIAILYVFLNGLLLPAGLLYTTLLTPFFLIWLWRYPGLRYIKYFFYLTVPLAIIHYFNGIEDYGFYIKSWVLFFTVFVFGLAFSQYLDNCHTLRYIFKKILLINGVMTVAALVFLFVPPLNMVFWDYKKISTGISLPRLQMLTYEPSYYSTVFVPVALYYLMKAMRRRLPQPVLYYCLVLIPLILSLSFGVLLGLGIALLLVLFWKSRSTIFNKKNLKYLAGGFFVLAGTLVVLAVFFPQNVLFRRIANIFAGQDTSFNGRTLDSFRLSLEMARLKSIWFGTGFGQSKLIGLDLYRKFYNWSLFTISDVRIPNGVADLFVTLGLVTVCIKLGLEGYYFYRTRVFTNYYRLTLFLFIFIYQFTGSFLTNVAELVIWILVFHRDLFPEFNVLKPKNLESPVHSESVTV